MFEWDIKEIENCLKSVLSVAQMYLNKRTPAILALILLVSTACLAQESYEQKIAEYLRKEMQAQQIPGVALAIVKDGKIVLARGYGLANVEQQVPVKPEKNFQ